MTTHPIPDDPHGTRHAGLDLHLPAREPTMRAARWLVLALLLLLAVGAAITVAQRWAHASELSASTAQQARLFVTAIKPEHSSGGAALTLPATLAGHAESPLYARANGYVKRWTKDIGSKVTRGELLIELDTPEVEQQLAQAQATRLQVGATLALSKTSLDRWEQLRQRDAVSQQELDERRGSYAQAQANVAAADAEVRRLQQTSAFKRVLAPFDGIVTQRHVEVGDLVSAGGSGRALLTVTQIDPLRVYVYVPQSEAMRIRPGMAVKISQSELAGRSFQGQVVRTAGAIDVATRTLQVEISLPNPDGSLLPGAYVEVTLGGGVGGGVGGGAPGAASASGTGGVWMVPNNALLFRPEGVRLAVVDGQGRVNLRAVTLGRDLGVKVEVASGLGAADRVIVNPPDSIAEGSLVSVVAPPAGASAAAGPGSAASPKAGG